MSKSLRTIQTLARLGRIFSQIVFVCCIVGAVCCRVGIAALLGINSLTLGGRDLTAMIIMGSSTGMETMVFACIAGLIACVAECILSKFANIYFRHELAAGTPFTMEGSKEILRLGILTIVIPLGALILEGIVYTIFEVFYPATRQLNMEDMASVGMGIMFILASVIFQYGAELGEQKQIDEV